MAKKIQPIERCDCDVIHEEIVNKVREKMPQAPNGDVYNCISGIGVSNFKIANYEEIMSNEEIFIKKYANFLESISHDKTCMSCTFLPICDGGCKYNSFLKQTPKDCWKEFLETLYSSDLIELYVLNQERVIVP